jgi:hypothetical protein
MGKKPKPLPPKPPQPFADQVRDWAVGRVRLLATVGTLVAAIAGGIVGYSKAADVIEPIWYASHSWVREHVEGKIKLVQDQNGPLLKELLEGQRAARIEQAEGKREAAEQKKASIQAELVKGGLTATAKDILEANTRDLDNTIKRLNAQIRSLSNER